LKEARKKFESLTGTFVERYSAFLGEQQQALILFSNIFDNNEDVFNLEDEHALGEVAHTEMLFSEQQKAFEQLMEIVDRKLEGDKTAKGRRKIFKEFCNKREEIEAELFEGLARLEPLLVPRSRSSSVVAEVLQKTKHLRSISKQCSELLRQLKIFLDKLHGLEVEESQRIPKTHLQAALDAERPHRPDTADETSGNEASDKEENTPIGKGVKPQKVEKERV